MNKKNSILTDEEREIEASMASGEWVSVGDKYKKTLEDAAKQTISEQRKEARVNIRMTEHQLGMVKSEAEREGIPYQTLMSSILHKYLTGQLVDRRIVDELQTVITKKLAS
jgi:predicted DNA binding CopG/RHH family protein